MLDLIFPPRCAVCNRYGEPLCHDCLSDLIPAPDLSPPPGMVDFAGLFAYEGATKDLIAAIKFNNHRRSIPLLGRVMAELVEWPVEVVTWAPTSRSRRRERGYDQAELLARAVGRSLRLPTKELLRRENGASQTRLSREERLHGPRFAAMRAENRPVLLVDDVRTTGSTLSAATDALIESGTSAVAGLTLAVTL